MKIEVGGCMSVNPDAPKTDYSKLRVDIKQSQAKDITFLPPTPSPKKDSPIPSPAGSTDSPGSMVAANVRGASPSQTSPSPRMTPDAESLKEGQQKVAEQGKKSVAGSRNPEFRQIFNLFREGKFKECWEEIRQNKHPLQIVNTLIGILESEKNRIEKSSRVKTAAMLPMQDIYTKQLNQLEGSIKQAREWHSTLSNEARTESAALRIVISAVREAFDTGKLDNLKKLLQENNNSRFINEARDFIKTNIEVAHNQINEKKLEVIAREAENIPKDEMESINAYISLRESRIKNGQIVSVVLDILSEPKKS